MLWAIIFVVLAASICVFVVPDLIHDLIFGEPKDRPKGFVDKDEWYHGGGGPGAV
jgi:hypothetical protein